MALVGKALVEDGDGPQHRRRHQAEHQVEGAFGHLWELAGAVDHDLPHADQVSDDERGNQQPLRNTLCQHQLVISAERRRSVPGNIEKHRACRETPGAVAETQMYHGYEPCQVEQHYQYYERAVHPFSSSLRRRCLIRRVCLSSARFLRSFVAGLSLRSPQPGRLFGRFVTRSSWPEVRSGRPKAASTVESIRLVSGVGSECHAQRRSSAERATRAGDQSGRPRALRCAGRFFEGFQWRVRAVGGDAHH